jgi:hypothetical protein
MTQRNKDIGHEGSQGSQKRNKGWPGESTEMKKGASFQFSGGRLLADGKQGPVYPAQVVALGIRLQARTTKVGAAQDKPPSGGEQFQSIVGAVRTLLCHIRIFLSQAFDAGCDGRNVETSAGKIFLEGTEFFRQGTLLSPVTKPHAMPKIKNQQAQNDAREC